MPVETTLFSHIIPVVLGFFGIILIASGLLDEKKHQWVIGIILFVLACIFPYVVLGAIL